MRAGLPKLFGGISGGDAVISARRGGDARGRDVAHQKIGEGAARLERSGVLQQFELQPEPRGLEAEFGGIDFNYGGAPDVRADQSFGCANAVGIDGHSVIVGEWPAVTLVNTRVCPLNCHMD